MDSRRIGSDQILRIRSEQLELTIKGDTKLPKKYKHSETGKDSIVRLKSRSGLAVFLLDEDPVEKQETSRESLLELTTSPLFFEQKSYEIIIESYNGHKVDFWHENQNIRRRVSPVGNNQTLLTGVIRFDNNIGFSDLIISIDGEEFLTLTIEVFPSKMSYKEDYQALIEDISKELYSLTFDVLKKTYKTFEISSDRQSTPVEFFSIIQAIYADFLKATDLILSNPHHVLQKEYVVSKPNKIKTIDAHSVKWLSTHSDHIKKDGALYQVDKALTVKKRVTYDTRENRFSKYMMQTVMLKLLQFGQQFAQLNRETDPEINAHIERMVRELSRRINSGFMLEVSALPENTGMSLVFGMAPGYKDLYKYYLMLQHGLSITGELYRLSLKDLAVLYEYWCFIKLNSLMKEKYHLTSQDIIKVNRDGLFFTLAKGNQSEIKYATDSGETITLSYNQSSSKYKLPTGPQKPDNILKLQKTGSSTSYEYVFDAKYRIDPAEEGSPYYISIAQTPGPKVDDINTMHRYRDAIVYEHGTDLFERVMFGAFVLFPYGNEEEYKTHRFFKSIAAVNIGGLPFLPSATNMVSDLLEELINESPEKATQRKPY